VRQAATQDHGQDGAVLAHLRDEIVQRFGELLPDGFCRLDASLALLANLPFFGRQSQRGQTAVWPPWS
jgi:hypothetical protein